MELAGVFYHVGENEMSMPPYRQERAQVAAVDRFARVVRIWRCPHSNGTSANSRLPMTSVSIPSMSPAELERIAAADSNLIHIKAFDLPKQEKKLVIDTAGIVRLGEVIAENYLQAASQ